MSRRTLIKLINDTAAYFDRIISNIISLCSRKNDIPDELCRLQAKTLQTIKYKVQTALGISKEHYQHSTMYPIYGSGQGVGNSSTNWLFTSSPMMNAFEKNCKGCTMISPNGDIKYSKYNLGFIDDKTQYANDWKNNDIVKIKNNIQHAAQSWEELLYTSGRKLDISKCRMHIIAWTRDNDGT